MACAASPRGRIKSKSSRSFTLPAAVLTLGPSRTGERMSDREQDKIATWRIVTAFLLDLFGAFFVLGIAIGSVTGGLTEGGFELTGWPAMLLFGGIIAYFVCFDRFLGGTIGKRLLGAVRR